MTSPSSAEQPTKRRRVPKEATARFKPDNEQALTAAEAMVPQEHLARRVRKLLTGADVSQVEAQYSALGRRGYAPRQLLCVWVYASLIGVHHATKLARLLETDNALRLLAAGHAVSRPVLNRFRMRHGALFQRVLEQTVHCALKQGWIQCQELAVDSLRLRAHAGVKQVRVRKRSARRLKQLARVDTSALSQQERQKHQQKVDKHTQTVELCTQARAGSVVRTNKAAALMQFPGDVYLPGHRLTVTASGAHHRFVVGAHLNAAANDTGQLGPALLHARGLLSRAGLPCVVRLHATADAGYFNKADLAFAQDNTPWVDVLVEYKPDSSRLRAKGRPYFGRDAFRLLSRHEVLCPADKKMLAPQASSSSDRVEYKGDGCSHCPLHSRCTPSLRRRLVVHWDYQPLLSFMLERLSQEGARARYHQRMATVEPVFSLLEDGMGFRRVSSRHPVTVPAEVGLKLLAYNVSRLFACSRLSCAFFLRRTSLCCLALPPAFLLILINPHLQQ